MEEEKAMMRPINWQWNWPHQLVFFDPEEILSERIAGVYSSKTHVHVCAHIHSEVWLWN